MPIISKKDLDALKERASGAKRKVANAAPQLAKAAGEGASVLTGGVVGSVGQVGLVAAGQKPTTAGIIASLVGFTGWIAGKMFKSPTAAEGFKGVLLSGITNLTTQASVSAINKASKNVAAAAANAAAQAGAAGDEGDEGDEPEEPPAPGKKRDAALNPSQVDDVITRARREANQPAEVAYIGGPR